MTQGKKKKGQFGPKSAEERKEALFEVAGEKLGCLIKNTRICETQCVNGIWKETL